MASLYTAAKKSGTKQDHQSAASQPARPARSFWRIGLLLVLLIAVAILVDFGIMTALRGRNAAPVSAVIPSTPHLQELRALTASNPNDKDLHLALGYAYLDLQHYGSARAEFDAALRLGADEWKARTGRTRANLALERSDLADVDLQRLIQLRPRVLETYLTLEEVRQHADDWPGAHKILDQIPARPDGLPDVEADPFLAADLLATAYSHLDDWTRTLALVNACLKQQPGNIGSRVMLGKALHATGKKVEAIPYLTEGIKAAPKNAELYYLLGTAYQTRNQKDDSDRALYCFQTTVQLDDKHGAATLALAKECDRRAPTAAPADRDKLKGVAAYAYVRAAKLGMEGHKPFLRSGDLMLELGNREEGWYRRGLYYENTGHPELAVIEYEKLTHLHDCCRSGYIHLARVYGAMHQPAKALDFLLKAQQLEPAKAAQLKWSVIQAYGQMPDGTPRLKMLKDIAAEKSSDSEEAAFQLADIAEKEGKYPEAMEWLQRCIEMRPEDGIYRWHLGKILLEHREDPANLKAAIRHLEVAVRTAPDEYNAFYYLGLADTYSGNYDDAVLALRHIIDIQPENGEGYQTLAQALTKAGRKDEAKDALVMFRQFEDFQQARETLAARCKRNPKDPEAQRRMAEFHMRAHEYTPAVERFQQCLTLQPDNRQARLRIAEALGYLGRREEQKAQLALLANSTTTPSETAPAGFKP